MTITIGTIRQWQPAVLEEAVRTLLRHRDALTSLQDEVTGSTPPSSWHGEAADMAEVAHGKVDECVQRITGEVSSVWAATLDAADSLTSLRGTLTEAENLAHHHEFTIHDDGTIASTRQQDLSRFSDITDPDTERRAVELELRDRVGELQRRADDIDSKFARVLTNAHDDLLLTSGESLQEAAQAGARAGDLEATPPPNSTAGANAAWWKSLSQADKDMVLATKPDWIGNLDGVPAAIRDRANRARLERLRHEAWAALSHGDPRTPDAAVNITASQNLDAIRALDKELSLSGKDGLPRQLLMLDLSGTFPKAAVATGNVDTAEHVAVQTPGIRSNVAGSLEANQAEMTALHQDSCQKVAAISWIGYEPPQTVNATETLYNDRAKAGAEDLARFYEGINAARGELSDPHLTALGHSYGGVTTEYALTREGTGVDDAVVYGTPGHPVDDVSQLHIPQDSFHTLSKDIAPQPTNPWVPLPGGDPVEEIGNKGGAVLRTAESVVKLIDVSIPDGAGERGDIAGAQELSADAQPGVSRGVTDHSDYMNRGTTSYNNVVNVTTGNTDELIRKGI